MTTNPSWLGSLCPGFGWLGLEDPGRRARVYAHRRRGRRKKVKKGQKNPRRDMNSVFMTFFTFFAYSAPAKKGQENRVGTPNSVFLTFFRNSLGDGLRGRPGQPYGPGGATLGASRSLPAAPVPLATRARVSAPTGATLTRCSPVRSATTSNAALTRRRSPGPSSG
jgi:hypothetical protein